ncbi:MAG: DUF3179 domain-containing protein [Calditrichaeota bacterium]|nr:MAG: DUF3179 domain-containing protein [Calditrichota bacterium]
MKAYLKVFGLFGLAAFLACSSSTSSSAAEEPAPVVQQEEKIFIIDRTGKQWDVTHAVKKYGMKADEFQFGLGPNAIPPINNPIFAAPGDPNYPSLNQTFLVIGTILNDEPRAYPLFTLTSHEVVNDRFGDRFVAIGY